MDEIHKAFREYLKKSNRSAIIELLLEYLKQPNLPVMEQGWALWNICDSFAVQELPHQQIPYHRRFHELVVRELSAEYLHWVVVDSTQSTALAGGGYYEEWLSWYLEANETAPRIESNRGARFEAHRAAVATFTCIENSIAPQALQMLKQLLEEDTEWQVQDYVCCNYYLLLADYLHFIGDKQGCITACDSLIKEIEAAITKVGDSLSNSFNIPILGSWEQNTHDPKILKVVVGNAANGLCRVGAYEKSLEVFAKAKQYNIKLTPYGRSLQIVALWKVHANPQLIKDKLSLGPEILPDEIKKLAPELLEFLE